MNATDATSKVWVFQQSTMESALKDWVDERIAAYSHKEELIKTVSWRCNSLQTIWMSEKSSDTNEKLLG